MLFQDLPIKRKVIGVIMLTSTIALLVTAVVFMAYDFVSYRQMLVRQVNAAADITANANTAAVAFQDELVAQQSLNALRSEPTVANAAFYDSEGTLFVRYPTNAAVSDFPVVPGKAGLRFEQGAIVVVEPVVEQDKQVGLLYVRSSLDSLYNRLRLYAAMAIVVLVGSTIVAFLVSANLQRRITNPILALADSARVVSERGDYSIRAEKTSSDELGLLTDAYNLMLARIQEQTLALRQREEQLRLTLEASRAGSWDLNLLSHRLVWDSYLHSLFGLKPGEFDSSYDHFLRLVHPEDRARVQEAVSRAINEKTPLAFEFRAIWPDGTIRFLASRGRAFPEGEQKPVRLIGLTFDISERRKAEQARSFLASLVDSSDDAVVGKDLTGTIVSWNAGATRMFGYTEQEIVGEPVTKLISPDRPHEETQVIEDVKRGQIRHFETVRVGKSGDHIDVSVTASPVRGEDGQIIGISSIARDITERKRSERELEESRARLSGVIGSAMDAIISVDASQRITIFNAAAEKMFDCPAARAIGQSLDRFIPVRFRRDHSKHVEQFGKTGVTSRAMGDLRPLAGLRADGTEFPIEASISQIEISGERIYTVILRDITERQRAQRELERHAATLREQAQMLDLANILVRDLNDRIILWNAGMEKMYGWTKSEALGADVKQLLRTRFPEPIESIRQKLFRGSNWEGELVHYHKDGRRIFVSSQWVLHHDSRGQPAAVLEANTDITERKLAEQEVRRVNEELEQRVAERTAELLVANQEMEAFTYSVAHDLRAPLRHIDAFARILN